MQIIFLGVHYQINNLEITDLIRFAHANPASLRTQETILVQNMSKIFQDYFANVRPQESNVHGGVHWNIYVGQTQKKCPLII